MGWFKTNFKWLYPGLRIKRWLFLALTGVILSSWGLALILEANWWTFLFFINRLLEEHYISYSSLMIVGIFFIILGLIIISFSLKMGTKSILNAVIPYNETQLVEVIYEKRQLKKGPKIVVIGGGTGLSALLRGLKHYTSNITAIVTVTDDGGCSGKLRGELGILPPGDLRNNLIALADRESLLEDLFNYRFLKGEGLEGRSLGNLLLAAMTDLTGDTNRALKELSKVLAVRGVVLPSTLSNVTLKARMDDGLEVYGETKIVKYPGKIVQIQLVPDDCEPVEDALKAIQEADAVIIGPGSLYTSIIPNLLIKKFAEAVNKSSSRVYYVCNVMTQPGETDYFTAADHVKAIKANVPRLKIDRVIVNTGNIPKSYAEKYKISGAYPVVLDEKPFRKLNIKIHKADLVNLCDLVRHDSDKLARVIMKEIIKDTHVAERIRILDSFWRNS